MQKRVQITTQLSGVLHTDFTFATSTQIRNHSMTGAPEGLPWRSPWGSHYPDF